MTDKPNQLYRMYDASGQLLYIGISVNALTRAMQHRHDKPWWPEVADMKVQLYPTRKAVEAAEREAIAAERPLWNIAHNGKRPANAPETAAATAVRVRRRLNRRACNLPPEEDIDRVFRLNPRASSMVTNMRYAGRNYVKYYADHCGEAFWYGYGAGKEYTPHRHGWKAAVERIVGWCAEEPPWRMPLEDLEWLMDADAYAALYAYARRQVPMCAEACESGCRA